MLTDHRADDSDDADDCVTEHVGVQVHLHAFKCTFGSTNKLLPVRSKVSGRDCNIKCITIQSQEKVVTELAQKYFILKKLRLEQRIVYS